VIGALPFSAPQGSSKKGARGTKKVEMAHPFYWAPPDPLRGVWQGEGGFVAQVIRADDRLLSVQDQLPDDAGKYQANIFRKSDVANDKPLLFSTESLPAAPSSLPAMAGLGLFPAATSKPRNAPSPSISSMLSAFRHRSAPSLPPVPRYSSMAQT
jgi:hypothetical protein